MTSSDNSSRNVSHLLVSRRFLPLFITQFFGALNDNVFKNALLILITFELAKLYDMNAEKMVTIVAAIFILPFFLFSEFRAVNPRPSPSRLEASGSYVGEMTRLFGCKD